jgi:hypothetical protein
VRPELCFWLLNPTTVHVKDVSEDEAEENDEALERVPLGEAQ